MTMSNQPKKSVLLQPQKKVGRSLIFHLILNLEYQIIKIINKQNNNTKMKREFTKLMAALALLLFIAPLGMWGQSTYTKVTTTPSNWSGTYVIVADELSVIFTGQSGSNTYGGYANVTISNNKVTGNFAAYEVEIEQSGNDYSMKHINSSKYLGWTGGNNLHFSTTAPTSDAYRWVFSTSSILNANDNTRKLQYNSNSPRFACYTSSQKVAYLYKKEAGATHAYTLNVTGADAHAEASLFVNGDELGEDDEIAEGATVTVSVILSDGYAYSVSVKDANNVAVEYDAENNSFTMPASAVTITVTTTAIPTHTASFSVNGVVTSSDTYYEGAPITFPATPANIDDKVFRGWTANEIEGTQSPAPEFVTSATMSTDDITFYAVFAVETAGEPVESMTQTLQYDTWNYSGSTTDKSTYRLFHTDSYIESAAFDLSKLSKVIVYGGTFGGNQYNSLTIGDGTNVWKDVTVTGKSETGTNTYTGGTALSGTKPLRIISNSGNASNTGVRISKVEIFTMEPSIAYTDYCTTVVVSSVATPAFTPATGTEFGSEGLTVTITCATENSTIYYTLDGTLPTNESIQYTVPFQLTTTTTVKAIAYVGTEASAVATATYNVVITNVYTAATSITPGKHYIIVGFADADFEQPYALGAQKNNNRNAVNVADYYDSEDDVLSIPSGVAVYELVISGDETNNYSIYDTENNGYLYTESGSNTLKNQETLVAGGKWTIARESDEYDNMIIGVNFNGTLRKMRFNYSDTNPLFACYNNGQKDIYLYEKAGDDDCHIYSATNIISNMTIEGDMNIHAGVVTVKEDAALTVDGTLTNTIAANLVIEEGAQLIHNDTWDVAATMQKNITAYTQAEGKDNYYLMALPFDSYSVEGSPLVTVNGNYDLYTFDGSQTQEEWQQVETEYAFEPAVGFLYANNEGGTLNLTGTLISSEEPWETDLNYDANTPFGGWNLVGNPFACNATISVSNYYVIDGEELTATTGVIAPLQGVMVQATEPSQQITFTKATGAKSAQAIKVNVYKENASKGAAVVDRAIVRFDESQGLEKFQLNPNHTKVYFVEDNKEYAVVRSGSEAEMPVSFKAEKSGSYTFNVETENVEMNYLHLIDNMTGADIDLLQTPSYTFEASNNDYESRFRLVFNANAIEENASTDSETFAYFNGSEWVINNSGNATLQVIDMMGRVLSSETLNGNANVTLNQAAGIYMLRLVNGENVKVQKVVVR